MESNILKALGIGVGILFFIGVVSIGLYLFNQSKETASGASEKLTSLNKELDESYFSAYDGSEISGSDVLSAIKKFRDNSGEVIVQVTTGMGTYQYLSTGTIAGSTISGVLTARTAAVMDADVTTAKDETNTRYINPVGKFDSIIARDSNDVIRAIVVVQK